MTLNSDFKVPSFISSYFNTLDHDAKKECVQRYKSWYKHDFTQLLLEYFEDELEKLVKEDENKSDFLSRFQFSYISARNRAKRLTLRDLIKKLDWRV